MQFKSYATALTLALSLGVLAGCSSSGGTQDGFTEGAHGSDAASGSGVASGQASSSALGAGSAGRDRQMADDSSIPRERVIYFEFDSDRIRSEFEPVLAAHARHLRNNGGARVVLQGHTDERGTREYNMALGERRARAVQRFLSVQGVSPSQVEVVSYGEERLAVRGNTEEAHAQNRRVVFAY